MTQNSWIVLHTKPQQEWVAIENAKRQAFQSYCPMVTTTRRHARVTDYVKKPLFPGYVFVRLDIEKQQWRPLLSTRGVQSVVRFGSAPGILPGTFVEELLNLEQTGELDELIKPNFQAGDMVLIKEGPFQDIIARVLSLAENDRIWLLMDMMGREVRILQKSTSVDHVEAS